MNYINLKLTQGYSTKIDKETYVKLELDGMLKWQIQKVGKKVYAVRTKHLGISHRVNGKIRYKYAKLYLHRYVMGFPDNMMIDHINGDPLDNRKSNLRIATARVNCKNKNFNLNKTHTYIGVAKSKGSTWTSQAQIGGVHFNVGYFDSEIDAARARDIIEVIANGEHAKPNFEVSWKFLKIRDLMI